MERVEFEQEQMVEELKEFEKKGIFSKVRGCQPRSLMIKFV